MLAPSHYRQHQPSAAVRHPSLSPYSVDYDIWAEMLIKSNRNTFGRPDSERNFGPWARKPLPQLTSAVDADDSDDLKSPPLMNTRAQMIERYRQEMMGLVRNMPEEKGEEVAAYELSLRDIVESPVARKSEESPVARKSEESSVARKSEVDTTEDSKDMNRKHMKDSRGENKGAARLLMKAVMPRVRAVLGARKRITGVGGGKGAKVSPKPSNSDCEERSCSDESCDSNGRRNTGGMGSCYLFLHKHGSKSMEI